ncbi:unnamed protein product [Effrenium voratum]|nr:unnamed protein product [Effrenium voratum]
MWQNVVSTVMYLDGGAPFPVLSLWLCLAWPLPSLLFWLAEHCARRRRVTNPISQGNGEARELHETLLREEGASLPRLAGLEGAEVKVMLASLEHSLPHLGCKATAGGLGKVMDLIARHHPTDILMIHPEIAEEENLQYTHDIELPSVRVCVDGCWEVVQVFQSRTRADSVRKEFLLLCHPWFQERTRRSIYPNPMSRRRVLQFFSLWNQSVGKLLERYRPDIFHCPDFHACIAPWYAIQTFPQLRVLLVLHNAEYQGSISTDMLTPSHCQKLAHIFDVSPDFVQQHLVSEGRFNMLKAGVDFLLEHQQGQGACAVSQYYAQECFARYSLFWQLPSIDGLDNPMLEEERAPLSEDMRTKKCAAKEETQRHFGLTASPEARLFVSLGRLVRQKGVDLLADIAGWLLSTYPEAQLIVIGPPADGFGFYAARKLESLAAKPEFSGRLSVVCQFLEIPDFLKWGVDFCLMPSRDEPFGYVDIEFAWRGAVAVGAQAGGLGKVPGFYYVAQNRENLRRLRRELRRAVATAMEASPELLQRMAQEALQSSFPLEAWQARLSHLYQDLLGVLNRCQSSELADIRPATWRGPLWFPEVGARQSRAKSYSFVDDSMEGQTGSFSQAGPPSQEFLRQELSEEELSELVQKKLDFFEAKGIDADIETILQAIGSDRDIEYEDGAVSKWLVSQLYGTARIHWLVSGAYIACPLSSLLVLVIAMEWGIRGSTELPEWFKRFPWFKTVFGSGGLDPPILNMLLFSVSALSSAMGAPLWACLARRLQPRKLLSAALLLQVPILCLMLLVHRPDVSLAVFVVFLQGLASSGSLIFIAFNFMMSIKADVSHAAYRMGMLEMVRYAVTWLITAYIFLASPSAREGTKEEPLPAIVYWLLGPVAVLLVAATLVPGVLFLMAPGPYREDWLPSWGLQHLWKKKSFVILAASDIIGCLSLFPSTCYIQWWLANGWRGEDLAVLSALFALALAGVTYLWGKALGIAIVHGVALLIGVALLLPPPPMLRAIVQEEVSTFTFLGRSDVALAICCWSLILEGVRSSCCWAVKVRVLNSRWRLLSYGSLAVALQGVASFASPFLCEWLARRHSSTFISVNEKELADAAVSTMVPLGLAQFAVQVCAAPWIRQDLEVASSSSLYREKPASRVWVKQTTLRRLPPRLAIASGCVLGLVALVVQVALLRRPSAFAPARRCLQGFQRRHCRPVSDETDLRSADSFAMWGSGHFGINEFGLSSTGKFNCLTRMRTLGGNTFVFWASKGRCQVWRCDAILDEPTSGEGEVWSQLCNMTGQNHVIAHLFEWPWTDIATECETYLGPAGFTAVQVSPPTEHVIGDSWSTRYQPVTFKLDSRSGSPQEFTDMVARCKKAGVEVMVDAILNHMASPVAQIPKEDRDGGKKCGGTKANATTSLTPCEGWSGTPYGNREFLHGTPGMDFFEKLDFHHYEGNSESNCGLPPWTNNRFLCDLYALVDLNTESVEVQMKLQKYLQVLFARGVTMLRLDAGMHVYSASFLAILHPFPFDYVVLEFFPGPLQFEKGTLDRSTEVGSLTNFDFGFQVSQAMFDSWNGKWVDGTARFGDLLHIGSPLPSCEYAICESPYPSEHALLFVDNHDQQRQRWKPDKGGPPASPVCRWNGKDPGDCRPIYKHGLEYHLAQLFMLAWPYGDAVRLMSSYAFDDFEQGPPGVQNGSWRDKPLSPLAPVRRCRSTPSTSPVTELYEQDKSHPWVCEHRWKGIPGLVRFRRLLGPAKVHTWSDKKGHAAFSANGTAFVALNRGFNWVTRMGSTTAWLLRGMNTSLPEGSYCNLALAEKPLPERWDGACFGSAPADVVIDAQGQVLQGEAERGAP